MQWGQTMTRRPQRPPPNPRRQERTGSESSSPAGSFLHRWLAANESHVGRHRKVLLREVDGGRNNVMGEICEAARAHYVSPEIVAKRLSDLGAKKTAALLKEDLPTSKRARSADLGEILATEFATAGLGFDVPIRRLQWKDGREMALRGDDIVAVAADGQTKKLKFLKGEAKSRAKLAASVVEEAATTLERDKGRPSRHSVVFVAKRLRERDQNALASLLEDAVLTGFRETEVEHLLFTFSGNDPDGMLHAYLDGRKKRTPRRHAVGIRVEGHQQFVRTVYEEL